MRWTRRERPVLALQRRKHALQAPSAARAGAAAQETCATGAIGGSSRHCSAGNMRYRRHRRLAQAL
ncbi:MAG: hypothetical protein J7639_33465, partial [Paenibacillaceae bacterium]|nr:hypothetical protein [Paenibacillaceae bacterium]